MRTFQNVAGYRSAVLLFSLVQACSNAAEYVGQARLDKPSRKDAVYIYLSKEALPVSQEATDSAVPAANPLTGAELSGNSVKIERSDHAALEDLLSDLLKDMTYDEYSKPFESACTCAKIETYDDTPIAPDPSYLQGFSCPYPLPTARFESWTFPARTSSTCRGVLTSNTRAAKATPR